MGVVIHEFKARSFEIVAGKNEAPFVRSCFSTGPQS